METILQLADLGGQVVICGLFLYYIQKRDASFSKIVSNHINHSTEALTRLLEYLKNGKK